MSLENWIAFVLAYLVISLVPGPSVLMVLSQALSKGRRAATACIAGDLAGGVVIMTASWLGLGLLIAASSAAFVVMKWLGVIYLAWLGVTQILEARRQTEHHSQVAPVQTASLRRSLGAGFLTGVLNPKAIIFYMAFLAQFIDPRAPQAPQFLILMATSTVLVGIVLGGYAILAARISDKLRSRRARRNIGYAGGGCLLGGSALMAATR